MKKFLTVLLALSVVFTYTVGSAFAATGVAVNAAADPTYTLSEVETAIYAQAQKNIGQLDAVKANFLANYASNAVTVEGVTLSKAAVEKVIDNIFKDIAAKINTEADTQKSNAVNASKEAHVSPVAPKYEKIDVTAATFADLKTASKDSTLYSVAADGSRGEEVTMFTSDAPTTYWVVTADGYTQKDCTTEAEFSTAKDESTENPEKIYTKDAQDNYIVADNFTVTPTKMYTCTVAKVDESGYPGYFTKTQKEAYENAVNAVYLQYDTAADVAGYITTEAAKYGKDLLTAEHAVQKAEVLALLDKVDVAKYSDNIPADADTSSAYYLNAAQAAHYFLPAAGYYSYQARVKAVLAEANKKLNKEDIVTTDTAANIATKIGNFVAEDAFFKTNVSDLISADDAYKVPTIQEEEWDTQDFARAQERLVSTVKSYLATAKDKEYEDISTEIRTLERKSTLTDAEKKTLAEKRAALAALDSEYAALEEAYTYKAKNDAKFDTYSEIKAYLSDAGLTNNLKTDFPISAITKTLATAQNAKVIALTAEADALNKMTGIDGAAMYDKDAVALALKEAIKAVYSATTVAGVNAVNLNPPVTADAVKAEMDRVINSTNSLEFNKKLYPSIENWATTDYDDDKKKEVKAIIADTKAAVRAAKTVAAVDEAFLAGYAKYDAVLSKTDRNNAQNEKAYSDKIATYTTELEILIDNAAKRYSANYYSDHNTTRTDLLAGLVGTAAKDTGLYEAYTADEIKAIYDKAVETVNSLKTDKELDAEAKAINEAIAAVKVPVTADSKQTILDLNDRVKAFTDYTTLINDGTNYFLRTSLLTTLTNDMAAIDAKEIKDAADAIMKDGKVDLTEKADAEKIVELVDAYAENYPNAVDVKTGNVKTVYEHSFVAQEVAAVKEAIAVIDATAVPVDAKAVKAARDAYDALGENAQAVGTAMYSKLLALEKLVAEQQIASVESLKIKASSKLYKGKKIRVRWTVTGDASNIDGYKVYKSTKAQSGYKYMGKTKKLYMDNKKGLKKGKRMYYRVRAYKVIDGKTYYSDYSNKANRIYK